MFGRWKIRYRLKIRIYYSLTRIRWTMYSLKKFELQTFDILRVPYRPQLACPIAAGASFHIYLVTRKVATPPGISDHRHAVKQNQERVLIPLIPQPSSRTSRSSYQTPNETEKKEKTTSSKAQSFKIPFVLY